MPRPPPVAGSTVHIRERLSGFSRGCVSCSSPPTCHTWTSPPPPPHERRWGSGTRPAPAPQTRRYMSKMHRLAGRPRCGTALIAQHGTRKTRLSLALAGGGGFNTEHLMAVFARLLLFLRICHPLVAGFRGGSKSLHPE